ncbi:DUF3768 domain-containing protein [Parvularcula flava]|uniref:DUF3768 domain-containing protein n=1 Tax=Aquisalinus luteolus TaxID=1566827 RepID=A0A8J3A4M9_9PROT|nr:DUF3768 domain-containing protein [Aquisalinus luteolus]NHK29625.1 DUF3768 domain-containing protein [Aquisalinus luteolus]GGI02296.1 hypothetical protein GCM10011355_34970 [Aquisalinus luteolus]
MSRRETIAKLNDQLRARVGVPVFLGANEPQLGTILMTHGIMALEAEQIVDVWMRVRSFSAFTEDNDPYGEHDFGSIILATGERVFFKIDYYTDDSFSAGAEDPADPAKSYRVLTIMLAEEY